jgi:hypothetical protein
VEVSFLSIRWPGVSFLEWETSSCSVSERENDRNFEGGWWGTMAKDEAYTAGLPAVPMMADPTTPRRARIPSKKKSIVPHHPPSKFLSFSSSPGVCPEYQLGGGVFCTNSFARARDIVEGPA